MSEDFADASHDDALAEPSSEDTLIEGESEEAEDQEPIAEDDVVADSQ